MKSLKNIQYNTKKKKKKNKIQKKKKKKDIFLYGKTENF